MDWDWNKQVEINLGKNFKEIDTQYLIDKISQFEYFDINFTKTINRDDKILETSSFVNYCVNEFIKLEDLYKFNNHKLKL
ncbi:MAG: hypothetical protein K9J13_09980 [Saprospiraceae bacterium]|nr:hypothetical protein [Saprospiraceae bacterium]